MNLIVCSEDCIHQKDGYCMLENPCTIPNPQGTLENRCIYLEGPKSAPGPGEGENAASSAGGPEDGQGL